MQALRRFQKYCIITYNHTFHPTRFYLVNKRAQALGRKGEEIASNTLQELGMVFLAKNYSPRKNKGEIDLVFRDGDCICFIEVKTRRRRADLLFRPIRAVNFRKRQNIRRTAKRYLGAIGKPHQPHRYDVIEVILQGDALDEVIYTKDAFRD